MNTFNISITLSSRTNINVGGFFVIDLDTRTYKEHKHYKTARNAYKKLGGYGKATIIPKADAINFIAQYKDTTTRL